MWVSVHALSGLALGASAPLSVGLTVLCALVLHLLLDLVPHWDYTRHHWRVLWAGLDVAVSVAAVAALTLLLDLAWRAVLAAVVSALPDLDVLDSLLPGAARRRWFPSHRPGFPHGETGPCLGIPVQVGVLLASLALLLAGVF